MNMPDGMSFHEARSVGIIVRGAGNGGGITAKFSATD